MKYVLTLLWICFSQYFYAQTPITIGKKYSINSQVLNEKRDVWIGLPTNYDERRAYPTLYVLDAEWQFEIVLSVMKELSANDKIPDHVVIGIPKIDDQHRFKNLTFTTNSIGSGGKEDVSMTTLFNKENTGGGKRFYDYIKHELIPFVEGKHKTNGFDVLIGHSLSGYFGAYILNMDSPFDAYQLYDPSLWYNKGQVITHFQQTYTKNINTNVFITTATGGTDKASFNAHTHELFYKTLKDHNINVDIKVYKNEYHGSVRLPGLIDGLSLLYKGYSFGYISPDKEVTIVDAEIHYKTFSDKVHYNFQCPKDVYRWIGYANYKQQKWREAIKAYALSLDIYIKDINVCIELAECYFNTKQYEESLKYCKLGLKLEPDHIKLKEQVKALENKMR